MSRLATLVASCALAGALGVAATARAGDFSWAEVVAADGAGAEQRAAYEQAMDEGDRFARMAAAGTSSTVRIKRIAAAVKAYEAAATASPDQAEPHLRAAEVMFALQVDCDRRAMISALLCPRDVDPTIARKVLAHWHTFERLAPLDPRTTDILFERAILHTKLATQDDLLAAVADYEALLDRVGSETFSSQRLLSLGNLAESHMMTGNLPAAIERYIEAIALEPKTSFFYGLAVAYDRDEHGAKAREILQTLGVSQFESWLKEVNDGQSFYVPDGEVFYYLALAREALGDVDGAITSWRRFLDSGAHVQYQPRARGTWTRCSRRAASTTQGKGRAR